MSFCKKVLIYPWETQESIELYKSLCKSVHIDLIAGCLEEPRKFVQMKKIPAPALKSIVDVNEWEIFIRDNDIDYIFPANGESRSMFLSYDEFFRNTVIQYNPKKLYKDNTEYTNILGIDCFTGEDGKILFSGAYQCTGNQVTPMPISEMMWRFIEQVKNRHEIVGYWNIECVQCGDDYKILCLSSEWSRGISLWRGLGINLPLLCLYQRMGKPIHISPQSIPIVGEKFNRTRFMADIKYEQVYIDLDDTIIISGNVNLQAIAFIYQCINNSIKVHLISKHRGDIFEYLERYRLRHLFDSVIWISKNDEKYKYINPFRSIFIDDAFRERIVVQKELEIPTFEVCALEYLIHE